MTENLLVSLNDIEEKEASWLVPQRMPKGQIIQEQDEKRWKQLNDECEAIDNQYSGRPEQRFVQSLLLGVVAELEREASHEGKTEATTTTQP